MTLENETKEQRARRRERITERRIQAQFDKLQERRSNG
jgi:hypothetical protein